MSTIDIDDIAHALEREERYAHRQEDVVWLEVIAYQVGPKATEEVGVLEITKEAKIYDQRQSH